MCGGSEPPRRADTEGRGEIYDEQPETFYDDTWGLPQVNGRSSKKNPRFYRRIFFILLKKQIGNGKIQNPEGAFSQSRNQFGFNSGAN